MPLDIAMFRSHQGGNPDAIKESQKKRFASVELVDEIIAKDEKWRWMTGEVDRLKTSRNKIQKEIGKKMKAKEDASEMVAETKAIGEEIIKVETDQKALRVEVDKMVGTIGNIVYSDVPIGNDEDDKHNGNRVERTWGNPRLNTNGKLLNHHDLLWRIGGYEPERGAAVAGHRGYFLKGPGVLLNQAFQAYGVAFLGKRGYLPLQPPYLMKKDVMAGVAQLSEFDEALYKVQGSGEAGESDWYLTATSEQPICGYHMGEWLREDSLPLKYAGLSTCFRKEAGSHGRDTWGIFRVHQFEKVEQFVIVENNLESSAKAQDEMIAASEEFYQSLGFPYQVINIVSGALNNAACKKLDLECWFPGYDSYRELVSCSNCTDYQSRAMEIRCGQKKMGDREKKYVHMLNSTLCATGRAICCLLETYQEENGVRVPEVLVPFMGGITFLPFVRESMLTGDPAKNAEAKQQKPVVKAPAPAADGPFAAELAAKGDEVRKLKADKADKALIDAAVEQLKALKLKASGGSAVAPSPAPVKADAPKKVAEPAPAPVADGPFAAEIAAKGDEVRKLKADKAEKALIMAAVEELKALKVKAGIDTPTSGGDKKEKQKQKPKEAAAKPAAPTVDPALALPPAVPILAPKYVTSAPPLPSVSASAANGVYTDGKLDLAKLDALLVNYSYVGGYMPASSDATTMTDITGMNFSSYVNVSRWHKNVSSFPVDMVSTWK